MAKLEKLTAEAADAAVAALEGWTRQDEKWISGSYRFGSFPAAIAFVGQIAEIAEELDHHPFIGIDYKKVTLRLTTWHAGGLTALDMASAQRYNEAYKASIAGQR
ncbi:4a-hydroxytetrahydrobiopterin dehydratase [Paenibacillus glycinis]|uniref:4a-hydroxytetrahydrobiopterin dehydratase n=1 Tax=Paenibacillus glycinis TaxID=2697035 RepID=A0ABW9XWW8_9BACL|nr:4a-hydroxytetrahydrobiopterin dehydratase [Paenibacillus glycinis]NBD27208.1 4a-hydroxytetrahydrobiopterin dehydratase [Paenibacillus glycinis]